jgi:hypothetical protein
MQTEIGTPIDRHSTWERPALVSGIVFALVQIGALASFAVLVGPHMPPMDAPFAEQAAFYSTFWDTIAITNYLNLWPTPFFLIFLGGLFEVLRRAEGRTGPLTVGTMSAAVALAMVWPIGMVIAGTGQGMARQGLDGVTVFAFDGVAQFTLALSGFPRAVVLAGTSLALLSGGAYPRWLGWTGIGLAAVALATTATLVVEEIFPFLAIGTLLFHVWIVALCTILLRRLAAVPARTDAVVRAADAGAAARPTTLAAV